MSAMDARNAGSQDKIVSVLHAQLKRVHGRLARTEALLRDEREARRDAERQLRERDNGAAAPTRALVEEAVAKASKAAEERDRAVADATEGRQALRENELLKRGMSNLSSSFEQQEERLRLELEEMGPRAAAGARLRATVSRRAAEDARALRRARRARGVPGRGRGRLGRRRRVAAGGRPPRGRHDGVPLERRGGPRRARSTSMGGDELEPTSPPRGASEPAG